ncbi:DUF2326 domain-containing protein [Alicycliphilus denitrificans]|uniref:DUF2326 domain-containing protein n=1 Tax=Alicycliphilus denitrificans TaxID=179636 RepID=UPI00384F9F36
MDGLIRNITFHAGINFIVDETPPLEILATGNNVGKTTVLQLIDFCLGASAKGIYTDPENKRNEDLKVKNYLIDKEVLITLTLTSDLESPFAEELVIERNFLPRKKQIRRINGEHLTEDAFEERLTNQLFLNHYGKKPTFRQLISHNIRYKDQSVNNTLKTLDSFTRDEEYEALYLFLLGCSFDDGDSKQTVLSQIRIETAFKNRLESKQTRSAYEASLSLLEGEIQRLDAQRSSLNTNPNLEDDLKALDKVRYEISVSGSKLSRLNLRRNLIQEAVQEVQSSTANIDIEQLKSLYSEVSAKLGKLNRKFSELVEFHNKMVNEKTRYIKKELPQLEAQIIEFSARLDQLRTTERELTKKLATSGSFEELEKIVVKLNEKHQKKGEYEIIIEQITAVEKNLKNLNEKLEGIDVLIFSDKFQAQVQERVNLFNKYFSEVSRELYGEEYALKFDIGITRTGQRVYKFSAFNTNFSSGKKQGEITCFDIAYTFFADNEKIPCYHFLLSDKKELMHDNQLVNIATLVERECKHVQFVASILRDKLPPALNKDEYFCIRLSQSDKLFRIEQHTS